MTDPIPSDEDGGADLELLSFGQFQADWGTWSRKLHRFALDRLREHKVPSAHLDADDVVQMAWLVLYRNQGRVTRSERYMYIVVRRLVFRAKRAADRYVADDLSGDFPSQPVSSAEQEAIERETTAEIHAARQRLTGRQQMVISALFDEGLSYEDVAAFLGISVGAVSAHRARALGKVRADLGTIQSWWGHASGHSSARAAHATTRHIRPGLGLAAKMLLGVAGAALAAVLASLAAVGVVVPALITSAVAGAALISVVIWRAVRSIIATRALSSRLRGQRRPLRRWHGAGRDR